MFIFKMYVFVGVIDSWLIGIRRIYISYLSLPNLVGYNTCERMISYPTGRFAPQRDLDNV
jgi:hypothetical protein